MDPHGVQEGVNASDAVEYNVLIQIALGPRSQRTAEAIQSAQGAVVGWLVGDAEVDDPLADFDGYSQA